MKMSNQSFFNNGTQGLLIKIVNVFFISLIAVLIKKFIPHINIFQIIFSTSIVCLCIILCFFHKQVPRTIPNTKHTVRSVSNAVAILTWIYSVQLIPVSLATSISAIIPIASVILAVIFLNEKINSKKIIALSLGLIGMSIAINPAFSQSPIGISLAIISALLWALHDTITKKQTLTDTWISQSFYTYVITIPLLLPFAAYYWKTPTVIEVLYILGISLIMLFNKFLLIKALTKASLSLIAPINFCRFVFASLLATLILGETTDSFSWYGTILVLGATMLTFSKEEPSQNIKMYKSS